MKIPKAIQKKKKRPINDEIKDLVLKLVDIFKNEFTKTVRKPEFEDSRNIEFFDWSRWRKRPFWFGEENIYSKKKKIKLNNASFGCEWDINVIKVYINYKGIYHGNLIKYRNYELKSNFSFYENYIKQIAHHEYGHTFITKTEFGLHPKEVRNYLKEIRVTDISKVPKHEKNKLKIKFEESKYGIIAESLKRFNLNDIIDSFLEFHADYTVFKKINKVIPIENLKRRKLEMSMLLKDFEKLRLNKESFSKTDNDEFSAIFFKILIYTQKIFIFNEWNQLINFFNQYNLNKFLDILHLISGFYEKIIKINSNFDSMSYDLFELAKILDKIDYEEIIFRNIINKNNIRELAEFTNNLKEK